MKNTTLLPKILKYRNNLIISSEFKEAYSLSNSFSRNRKLSFHNAVLFISYVLRKSISSEINNFIEDHKYLNLDTWNGFNILDVDGTSLQVPDTKECGEYFGLSSN